MNHNNSGKHILVVDDEPLVRRSLSELLAFNGYTVSEANNGKEAIGILDKYLADVVITDMKMDEMDGMQLLKHIRGSHPGVPVIIITSYGSIESAVDAMKEGAYDYVTKPIVDSEIKIILERLIQQRKIFEENIKLKEQLAQAQVTRDIFYDIVGGHQKMQKIYTLIEAVAQTSATVLIHGESGTGKRLIAQAIHRCSDKEKKRPFVEVSCGALTETLLESELFGHVKGAFTGAIKDRPGRFELAHGGTIFLDEIDAFSPALQVKLLRVLQEGEFERVGDTKTVKIDIRVIAATNQNLLDLIAQGKFRKDLYYRLNIISLEVPPLRERNMDIPLLAESFIKKHSKHISRKIEGLSKEVSAILLDYGWPGNIRELENVIERAIILSKSSVIQVEDLPDFLLSKAVDPKATVENLKLKQALKSPEKDLIIKALDSCGWNRNEAAKVLGINRTTLYKKMCGYDLFKDKKKGKCEEKNTAG